MNKMKFVEKFYVAIFTTLCICSCYTLWKRNFRNLYPLHHICDNSRHGVVISAILATQVNVLISAAITAYRLELVFFKLAFYVGNRSGSDVIGRGTCWPRCATSSCRTTPISSSAIPCHAISSTVGCACCQPYACSRTRARTPLHGAAQSTAV